MEWIHLEIIVGIYVLDIFIIADRFLLGLELGKLI